MSEDKEPKKLKKPLPPYPKGRAYDWKDLDHDEQWIYDNPEYDQ